MALRMKSPLPAIGWATRFSQATNATRRTAPRIPRWTASAKVDYECELAVIIGATARYVTPEAAAGGPLAWVQTGDRIRLGEADLMLAGGVE